MESRNDYQKEKIVEKLKRTYFKFIPETEHNIVLF